MPEEFEHDIAFMISNPWYTFEEALMYGIDDRKQKMGTGKEI